MAIRDGFFATIALALSSVALASIVYTDEYSHAAQAEANGYRALALQVSSDSSSLACVDEFESTAGVPAANQTAVR